MTVSNAPARFPMPAGMLFATTALAVFFTMTIAVFAADLSGSYAAKGRNPNGSAYSGKVTIVQQGERVSMSWRIGNDTFKGTGLIDGKVLEVDWGNQAPVVYVIRPDGTLHGTWGNGEALEKLSPVR